MRHNAAVVAPPVPVDHPLVKPVAVSGRGFYITAFALLIVIGWAFFAWLTQFLRGLGVTGMDRPVYWGVYITNFVFFVGISHAGTLISAILRVTGSEWRRPITRAAEAITVFALMVGPINVFFDLGRPDRVLNMFFHGQLHSPLMWDVICIGLYLVSSLLYLYLPLIPDIAELRDAGVRPRWFYGWLSLGWRGTERQKHLLERLIGIMAIAIIPIAVSVHTVVSWVFAMTVQPMWHSTIFGPYFVVGAIFTGIASILIAMAILRKVYHLEDYLKPIHFNNLGILLLVMACLWLYFTFAEYLTTFYGGEPAHMAVFYSKLKGEFAPMFWTMVVLCFILPFVILAIRRFRTISGTVVASISVNIGMWLERYTIVVPSLSNPRLPITDISYAPSWVEWSITAGCFAGLTLFYVLFSKIFPIISIWELKEGGLEVAAGTVITGARVSERKEKR
ncbi:MAG: NrfD/PsrC family molybdoenzyme membrane anchor subunit [Candidatus Zixiibacteriota bacterium]